MKILLQKRRPANKTKAEYLKHMNLVNALDQVISAEGDDKLQYFNNENIAVNTKSKVSQKIFSRQNSDIQESKIINIKKNLQSPLSNSSKFSPFNQPN